MTEQMACVVSCNSFVCYRNALVVLLVVSITMIFYRPMQWLLTGKQMTEALHMGGFPPLPGQNHVPEQVDDTIILQPFLEVAAL